MRVWELAKELGKESSALVAELKELGFEVTAPASGLSDEEADALQKAYAALALAEPPAASAETSPEPRSEAEAASGVEAEASAEPAGVPRGGSGYVLVRKGSISAGGVVVQKGGTIDEAVYRTLPRRVLKFFDKL